MSEKRLSDEMTLEEKQQFDIFWTGYRLGLDSGVQMVIKEFKKQIHELEEMLINGENK